MNQAFARYEALLGASDALISSRSMGEVLQKLTQHLRAVVPFDDLALLLADRDGQLRLALLEPETDLGPALAGSFVVGRRVRHVWETMTPIVMSAPELADDDQPLSIVYRHHGGKVVAMLPLRTDRSQLGVLLFGSRRDADYSGEGLSFMIHVAGHIAMAVENARYAESSDRYREDAQERGERLALLLDINNLLVTKLEYTSFISALRHLNDLVGPAMLRAVQYDYSSVALHDPSLNCLQLVAMTDAGRSTFPDIHLPIDGSPAGAAFRNRRIRTFRKDEIAAFGTAGAPTLIPRGIEAICCVPLRSADGVFGTLNVGSRDGDAFSERDIELLSQVAHQVSIAVKNALVYDELHRLKEQLAHTNVYLEQEIQQEHGFDHIIGASAALRDTLRSVDAVALTDATVLLLGETGTGKELLARAIHERSGRRAHTFVRMNAAALPSSLVESELFGHERGAFTGAVGVRVGRVELANRGSMFLDEVGDVPLEIQPKLLRVIQEREFERLGGSRTQHVDVRFIAATNRDLQAMVDAGAFREDLYYRLNVFPIVVPPLRERRQDIPALVAHFVQLYASRMHKEVTTIPEAGMDALIQWHWPGNIRELQNVIERAVILSRGSVLELRPADLRKTATRPKGARSLKDHERSAILDALRASGGRVGGSKGAAARLGINRTTLQSRMRKLGIARPLF